MELVVEVIYFSLILLVGILLRAIPHIRFHFPGTPDTFFFLNKIKNPDYKSDVVVYPKLFDQLLRFLVRNGETTDGYTPNRLSILLDPLTASIAYLFVKSHYDVEIALLTALIFLITPYVVRQGSTLSARSFGLFLASTSLLIISLPFPWNWIALVPIGITLLSHRLSTQALFFILIGLSILDLQNGFILLAGFVFAVLVSRGEYLTILRAHASAIARYYRLRGYPNERLSGSVLTPSFLGYLVYLILFIFQSYTSIIISFGGYTVPALYSIDIQFELIMIIWASVCFILLIFWLAGESYKHLSLASVPFAFLTSLLAYTDFIFLIFTIILIGCSFCESLYFQLRFQHIDNNLGHLLELASSIEIEGSMFAPKDIHRATGFFTNRLVLPTYLHVWDQARFDRDLISENVRFAIVMKHETHWFSSWEEVESSGNWVLFRRP